MDFAFDARTEELRERLLAFMEEYVYPAEALAAEQRARLASPWDTPAVFGELKAEARRQGLWNLFFVNQHGLPDAEYGAGLTNLQYAPLAEITGRSPHLAPMATNCAAPDTGNMELLAQFGNEQQKKQWLEPLLAGEIRSAFAMTEPEVASSDATNIETRIERVGDEYVVTGRKWYISGAMNPDCRIFIVMGKTDPQGADPRRQQSMVLVPRDTPGVEVRRAMTVYGYEDHDHGGHAEVVFDGVRVPAANLIGEEGTGFAIAQARLGPGRIHHCMRLIGMAERAVELMSPARDRPYGLRQGAGRARSGAGLDRGRPRHHRATAAAGAEDRLADGHGKQPGRAHRDPGHQDRDPARGRGDPGPGGAAARRGRGQPGLPAGRTVGGGTDAPPGGRSGRGPPALTGPPGTEAPPRPVGHRGRVTAAGPGLRRWAGG